LREASITGDYVTFIITVASGGTIDADQWGAVYMRDSAGNALVFGTFNDGTDRLGYFTVGENGVQSAVTNVDTAGPGITLFIRYTTGTTYEVGKIVAGVTTILATVTTGPSSPKWAGFAALDETKAGSVEADYDFSDAKIFEKNSPRGFYYLAYRNSALSGVYKIDLARKQLEKQGPAHCVGVADNQTAGFLLGVEGRLGIDALYPS
jgi:hypothetical protein